MTLNLTYGQCMTLLKLVNSRIQAEHSARNRESRVIARETALARGGVDVSMKYIERLTALKEQLIEVSGVDPTRLQEQLRHEQHVA